MEFVSWDYKFPIYGKTKNVPNHQPVSYSCVILSYLVNSELSSCPKLVDNWRSESSILTLLENPALIDDLPISAHFVRGFPS